MNKPVKIFILVILAASVLLTLLAGIRGFESQRTTTTTTNSATTEAVADTATTTAAAAAAEAPPEKTTKFQDEISDLVDRIRRDPVYHIVGVAYSHGDSSLYLTISDDTATLRYFNDTYHIPQLSYVDGIKIMDIHNRELTSESKRGDRLLAAFRNRWCRGNECTPLTTRIRQSLKAPESYTSKKLSLDWVGDSSFIVTNLFQIRDADGALKARRVQAQIDLMGKILVYNERSPVR
jgi:hypothetical protein